MERLSVKLTKEEKGYYSNLFQMVCREGDSRVEGKDGATFLKRSGLSREVLKKIWTMSAQTNLSWLERDEFYVAMRLIALTQNNMLADEKSIILNDPIPPLPKFDLKVKAEPQQPQSVQNSQVINQSVNMSGLEKPRTQTFSASDEWEIKEENIVKYSSMFDKYKDPNNQKVINFQTAFNLFNSFHFTQESTSKAIQLIGLQYPNEGFAREEFISILNIVGKARSDVTKIPNSLPESIGRFIQNMRNDVNKSQTLNIQPQSQSQPQISSQPEKKGHKNSLEDLLQSEIMKHGVGSNQTQQKNETNLRGSQTFGVTQSQNTNDYTFGNNQNLNQQNIGFTNNIQNNSGFGFEQSSVNNTQSHNNYSSPKSHDNKQPLVNQDYNAKPINDLAASNSGLINKTYNILEMNSNNKKEILLILQQQLEQDSQTLLKIKQILESKDKEGQQIDRQIKEIKDKIIDVKRETNLILDNINKKERENKLKAEELKKYTGKHII